MKIPIIDFLKCNNCGLCVTVCVYKVLIMVDEKLFIDNTVECDWCTQCEAVCPAGAISCPFEIVFKSA